MFRALCRMLFLLILLSIASSSICIGQTTDQLFEELSGLVQKMITAEDPCSYAPRMRELWTKIGRDQPDLLQAIKPALDSLRDSCPPQQQEQAASARSFNNARGLAAIPSTASNNATKPEKVFFPELDASQCVNLILEDGGRHAGGAFGGNRADFENRCTFPITVAYCSIGGDFDCGPGSANYMSSGIMGYGLNALIQPGASSMISTGGNNYGKGWRWFACNAENSQTTPILTSINMPPQGTCYIATWLQRK
jgi:hypothetical protein